MPDSKQPSAKPFTLSPKTVDALLKLTPEQRDEAVKIAAKLMAAKAKKAKL